jgi:copper(I)-binding protein
MSQKNQIMALLFALALVAAQCGSSAMPSTQSPPAGIVITNPTARVSGNNGAVYFDILNNSGQADAMIKTETDIATAEMHETTIDANQVMHMQPTPKVDLPVGETINFKAGGRHIMLIGVKEGVAAGKKIKLTLTFEHAAPMSFEVTISDDAMGSDSGGMEHKMDGTPSMDMPKK